ncbi:ABC transporter ATP-binding protein [Longispora fulva]|uniref:Putative ABC transport system ATP-binding protein n=1 Tax=Longispora fulva TaxID=619741 RepID=A0A8J7KNF2_9ACTN|nr:ABC transporter ATP-binding protein [Longispora fulva]MBG6135177.1 putative ABC transport system ATP-binding protein [Longispora fulva]GIG56588.1 ABC transporter ATP-binding protein [Longispora fulva]
MTVAPILELDSVSHAFQGPRRKVWVLKNVTYAFEPGTFYTILGPSGSGKTTMLSLASGLDSPVDGRVLYRGEDVRGMGLARYRNRHVATIFQSYNLLTYMSAVRNVTTAMEITGVKGGKTRAMELLERLGLDEQEAKAPVLELSGGQQQRVAIARALACDVDILFADEPTGNLDGDTAQEMVEVFRELAHEQGTCVIVVTHSQEVARQSDQVLTLTKGKIARRGR